MAWDPKFLNNTIKTDFAEWYLQKAIDDPNSMLNAQKTYGYNPQYGWIHPSFLHWIKIKFMLPKRRFGPCGEQKIEQFRDHLMEYGLGTHFGPTMHRIV